MSDANKGRQGKNKSLDPVDYLPFVRRIALRIARRLPSHVGLEDLIGAGVVGLLEAIARYDDTRNTDLEAYAEFRVRGAILDELRRRDLMARDARSESKQIEACMASLRQNLGREPEEGEVAAALGMSEKDLRLKMEKLIPVRVMSLEDIAPKSTQAADNPMEMAARRQLLTRLEMAIGRLKTRQQEVLHLYYSEALTLREIGEVLGVTESRVCQILSEITLRLRSMLDVKSPLPKTKAASHAGKRPMH